MNNKFKEPNEQRPTKILYITAAVMVMTVICLSVFAFINEAAKEKTPVRNTEDAIVISDPVKTGPAGTDHRPTIKPTTEPKETEKQPVPVKTPGPVIYYSPLAGRVSKSHDAKKLVYSLTMNDKRVHFGVDIEAEAGSDVLACAAGVIDRIYVDPFMGYCVSISHGNGMVSHYKNLDGEYWATLVEDAEVKAGDKIGEVGSSAIIERSDETHLHFEMTYNGDQVDPLDYIPYDRDAKDVFAE